MGLLWDCFRTAMGLLPVLVVVLQDFKIVPQLCSLEQLHEVFASVNNCDEYGFPPDSLLPSWLLKGSVFQGLDLLEVFLACFCRADEDGDALDSLEFNEIITRIAAMYGPG